MLTTAVEPSNEGSGSMDHARKGHIQGRHFLVKAEVDNEWLGPLRHNLQDSTKPHACSRIMEAWTC